MWMAGMVSEKVSKFHSDTDSESLRIFSDTDTDSANSTQYVPKH